MSLLNLASDGLPQLLVLLHATVIRAGRPMTRNDLLDAVAPPGVVADQSAARRTFNRWKELGFFVETDEKISLSTPWPGSRRVGADTLLAFTRREACRCALSEINNPDLWAIQESRAADLTRSLSWMLLQDVGKASFDTFTADESAQLRGDPERQLMRNETRRVGLRTWSRFLGFSSAPYADIDPTLAIRDVIPEILKPGAGLPAATFVERIAEVLPVLDGGVYQMQVLQEVNVTALPSRRHRLLSSALSRALLNLRASSVLTLDTRADTGSAVTLSGVTGERVDLTFQWISRRLEGDQ